MYPKIKTNSATRSKKTIWRLKIQHTENGVVVCRKGGGDGGGGAGRQC